MIIVMKFHFFLKNYTNLVNLSDLTGILIFQVSIIDNQCDIIRPTVSILSFFSSGPEL